MPPDVSWRLDEPHTHAVAAAAAAAVSLAHGGRGENPRLAAQLTTLVVRSCG